MIKNKWLIGLLICFISLQVSVLVIFAPISKGFGGLNSVEETSETTQNLMEQAFKEEEAFPFLQKIRQTEDPIVNFQLRGDYRTKMARGRKSFYNFLDMMNYGMYGSIFLIIFFIIMLALLKTGAFFKYIGYAFFLGGALAFINAFVLYYFSVMHFDVMLKWFYEKSILKPFIEPMSQRFFSSVLKNFSKMLVKNNIIGGAIAIGGGFISIILHRFFVKQQD